MRVKLSRPFKVGEAEVTELELKLETLTGADALRFSMLASQKRGTPFVVDVRLDEHFQAEVAAHAAGVEVEVLRKLPLPDYLAVTGEVLSFLTSAG